MKKLPDSIQAFINKLKAHNEEENRKAIMKSDLYPIATEPQEALQILCDLFLGEKWYVGFPLGVKQVNTLIVDEILYKYSHQYKKEVKKYAKEVKNRRNKLRKKEGS